jgi:hypothetical protein
VQPRMQSWVVFRERYLVSKGAESILTRFSPWLRSVPRTSVLGYIQEHSGRPFGAGFAKPSSHADSEGRPLQPFIISLGGRRHRLS